MGRRKKIVLGGVAAVALAAISFIAYRELVKSGVLRYNKYDRRARGQLRVGATAPDLELSLYDGSPVRLSGLWAEKPVVLVFGSCT